MMMMLCVFFDGLEFDSDGIECGMVMEWNNECACFVCVLYVCVFTILFCFVFLFFLSAAAVQTLIMNVRENGVFQCTPLARGIRSHK